MRTNRGNCFTVQNKSIGQKHVSHIDLSPLLALGNRRHTLEKLAATTQADMNKVRKAETRDMKALDGTPPEKLVDVDKSRTAIGDAV